MVLRKHIWQKNIYFDLMYIWYFEEWQNARIFSYITNTEIEYQLHYNKFTMQFCFSSLSATIKIKWQKSYSTCTPCVYEWQYYTLWVSCRLLLSKFGKRREAREVLQIISLPLNFCFFKLQWGGTFQWRLCLSLR